MKKAILVVSFGLVGMGLAHASWNFGGSNSVSYRPGEVCVDIAGKPGMKDCYLPSNAPAQADGKLVPIRSQEIVTNSVLDAETCTNKLNAEK